MIIFRLFSAFATVWDTCPGFQLLHCVTVASPLPLWAPLPHFAALHCRACDGEQVLRRVDTRKTAKGNANESGRAFSCFGFFQFGKELEQHNRPPTSRCCSHQWCTSLVYSEYANWHVNGNTAVAALHENSLFGPPDHERRTVLFVEMKSMFCFDVNFFYSKLGHLHL